MWATAAAAAAGFGRHSSLPSWRGVCRLKCANICRLLALLILRTSERRQIKLKLFLIFREEERWAQGTLGLGVYYTF
jgi:hypothetical protein